MPQLIRGYWETEAEEGAHGQRKQGVCVCVCMSRLCHCQCIVNDGVYLGHVACE